MKVRLFSDNTPKIEGISADITLDVDLEIEDKYTLISIVEDRLKPSFREEGGVRDLAENIVDELMRDYVFVRK